MADRLPQYGDFNIASEMADLHEWVCDEFIDGFIGKTCTLVYPPKQAECPNCYLDPDTGRSANIYRSGGPQAFTTGTICPWCGGEGRESLPQTATVRLRIYWEPKDWTKFGFQVNNPEAVAMVIGYMDDYPKVERATEIVLDNHMAGIRRLSCRRSGEAKPWGFRHSRYFVQMLERQGR